MARSRRPQTPATPSRKSTAQAAQAAQRSLFLPLMGVLILIGSIAAGWWLLQPGQPGPVILVSIDTLRADHLSIHGYTKGRTPTIDALAREGVVFDKAYAHAPQTLPSHASLFTGQLPFEHGVRDNLGFTLKAGTPTLASTLRAAGYRTGGFVSSYVLRKSTGMSEGFDVYDDEAPAGSQERSVAQVQRGGDATLAAAEKWLSSLADPKFFLFLHLYEPHAPYTPPAKYKDLAPYDGEIAYADEIVGRLIATLKARKLYDNATIVLLSDHGEDLNDHGEEEHGLFLYNSTIHVPLVVKLPDGARGGSRIGAPVQHIDVLPTIAALVHAKAPALPGRNLSAALLKNSAIPPRGIYAEAMYARYHFGWSELQSLTDDRFRFIKAPKQELYDLERDGNERTNVAGERGQVAAAMQSALDGLVNGRGIDAQASVSNEDRQRLASLGYIGAGAAASTGSGSSLADPKDKAGVLRTYRQAINALGEGRLLEGVAGLRAILQTEPGMADVWNQLGTVLARLERNQESFEAFQHVIQLQPSEPIALIDAAQMLMKLGRYDEARKHAEAAVSKQPLMAHEMLAKIALAANDPARAIAEGRLAEQADANYPLAEYLQGVIAHQRNDFSGALPHFLAAYEKVKDRTMQMNDLRYYIADSLARAERAQEAEKFFKEEIALYPNNTRARLGLAMLYEAAGQPDAAESTISTTLALNPTPDAYAQAAKLWRLFGQPARAAAVEAAARERFKR